MTVFYLGIRDESTPPLEPWPKTFASPLVSNVLGLAIAYVRTGRGMERREPCIVSRPSSTVQRAA